MESIASIFSGGHFLRGRVQWELPHRIDTDSDNSNLFGYLLGMWNKQLYRVIPLGFVMDERVAWLQLVYKCLLTAMHRLLLKLD